MSRTELPLGGRRPPDDRHVVRFPYAGAAKAISAAQVDAILAKGVRSELPSWHRTHDQGSIESSCVGHACVMERAITNLAQRRAQKRKPYTVRYDPIRPWRLGKAHDDWPETLPDDDTGTSARAVYDVLRDEGALPIRGMKMQPDGRPRAWGAKARPSRAAGVVGVNRWCSNVDEIRRAFAEGYKAVALGAPWYSAFESWSLEQRSDAEGRVRYWMRSNPRSYQGGGWRGIHETCLFGADDRIEAFWLKNSWNDNWGEHSVALLPYAALADCYGYWAEAAVVMDR